MSPLRRARWQRGTTSRRGLLCAGAGVCGALAAALLLPAVATAGLLAPESGGSPNADQVDTLYKIVLGAGLAVLLGVGGALAYSLVRFKARRGGVAAQTRGHARLEIGWTLAAVALVVALTVLTLLRLPAISDPSVTAAGGAQVSVGGTLQASLDEPRPERGRAVRIAVVGQQYIWRFDYPNGAVSYYELVVPVGRTVLLDITSQDVIHSWWVPELGGKFDAVPGYTNHTWFRIPRAGVYRGQCAELCGQNHADMRAQVRALPPARYRAWVKRQRRLVVDAQDALAASRAKRSRSNPARR